MKSISEVNTNPIYYLKGIDVFSIIISICIISTLVVLFIYFLDYSHSFVHPDYYRYILPETLRDGLGLSWKDVVNTMQLRSPGEFRPRFLAYGFQTLDQKTRLFLYNYILIYPTFSPVAWFFQLILGPYFLYKSIYMLTGSRQSGLLSFLIYISSIGFLSGFTMGLLQGKALVNVIIILSFYFMTVVYKKRQDHQLFYETAGKEKYLVLLTIFLGLFIDEFPIFCFVCLPLIFPSIFFVQFDNKISLIKIAKNFLFFGVPGFFFLAIVMSIIPYFTMKHFGFEFDYLGNTLALGDNTRGAISVFKGPYASFGLKNIIDNFSTMFGMSLAPWQTCPLKISEFGDYYGGQINNLYKIIILSLFFSFIGYITRKEKDKQFMLLRMLVIFGLFFLFLSLVLVRHIPIATGYYYGAPFSVYFSILLGICYAESSKLSKFAKIMCITLIVYIVFVQIDNFIPINRGWIKTHNEDISRPSFSDRLNIREPIPVNKAELKSIWMAWKNHNLSNYLQENAISSGAIYLVYELETLDRVNRDGFVRPVDWLKLTTRYKASKKQKSINSNDSQTK